MNDTDFDTLLNAYQTADPGAALRDRIITAAPRQRIVGRAWRWAAGLSLGLGLATSAAAGVAAAFTLAPPTLGRLIEQPTGSDAASSSLADPGYDAADG